MDTAQALGYSRLTLATISQLIATTLCSPAATQIELQLQMRNCAVHKFIHSSSGAFFLHGYNETPHIGAETQHLLTYS